ncbi:MAG TPA: glycosyltransferase family 4 protein [Geminicoccaceae bacterium]
MAEPSPHLVHLFPTFGVGDVQLRTARLIDALGTRCRHTIVALDRCFDARALIRADLDVGVIGPPPGPGRSLELRRLLKLLEPDLLLACGRSGAFDCAPGLLRRSAPLILLTEGTGDGPSRTLAGPLVRRLLRPQAVVTSSERLRAELQAGGDATRVELVPHGVGIEPRPAGRRIPGLQRGPGEVAIGALIPPQGRHLLGQMLQAFREAPNHEVAHLVLFGGGPERSALAHEAERLEVGERVLFPGSIDDPAAVFPELDLFALAPGREPHALLTLEAMAAGLPLIGIGGPELRERLAPANREFLVEPGQLPALTARLDALLRSTQLRRQLGRANRDRARDFPLAAMVGAFDVLIDRLLHQPDPRAVVPDEAG